MPPLVFLRNDILEASAEIYTGDASYPDLGSVSDWLVSQGTSVGITKCQLFSQDRIICCVTPPIEESRTILCFGRTPKYVTNITINTRGVRRTLNSYASP